MKPLDNLCHPVSVIKEAEELAADAFAPATRSYGGRNYISGPDYDSGLLQERGQNYSAAKMTPQRH